jgi:hypothetical protein
VRRALLLALAAAAAVAIWSATASSSGTRTIRVVVPIAQVKARGGTAVNFRESYTAPDGSSILRQDAIGIATVTNGMFFGAITLHDGQIVYGGATTNQDDFAYAVLGGSGAFADARGTVTTQTLSKTRVAVTIRLS